MPSKKVTNVLDVIERLKKASGCSNDAALAKLLGVGGSRISMWKKRGVIDLMLIVQKIERINTDWLLNGAGEMMMQGESSVNQPENSRSTAVHQAVNEGGIEYRGSDDGNLRSVIAIGSKMTPDKIAENDFLIIDLALDPKPGDMVLRKSQDAPEIAEYRTGDPRPIGVVIKLVRTYT